jgi:hypothetical protein
MEKEFITIRMVRNMKGNGRMAKEMGKVSCIFQMERKKSNIGKMVKGISSDRNRIKCYKN